MKWDWLRDLLENKEISQSEFAKKIDWQQTRVSELLSGKRDFPYQKIDNVAKFLNLNANELAAYNSNKIKNIPTVSSITTVSLDMLDATACCGTGIDNFKENIIGSWHMPISEFRSISLSSTPENVKLLKVKGDSMVPTLKDGDWVLVDISKISPDSDGMFLLYLSTGLAVKRIQGTTTDEVIVKSDNPKYDDFNRKLSDIKVLGKIIYILNAEKVG